jgi:8-oxo-dGTP pyrophosphatase MutT (NUDIX family)
VDNTRRLPPALVDHARAFLAGDRVPVTPRGAATVVLLRDGQGGYDDRPQVYLLRRHLGMAFAAGMYAFPGGTVDERDSDSAVAWAGPSPAAWAERLECDETQARGLVCAGARELFEESGVLLAGRTPDEVVADTTGEDWERERGALVDRSLAFGEFLDHRGLVLRTDLLAAWAHWTTPEFEPRRYDTRFFVAAMPSGQRARDVSGEADRVTWMRAGDALAAVDSGAMAMLPPTYITLREIGDFRSVDDVWAAAAERRITTVVPGVEIDGEVGLLTLPPWAGA